MLCPLEYEGLIRQSLDRTQPGWAVQLFPCPKHGEDHELRSGLLQPALLAHSDQAPRGAHSAAATAPRPRLRQLPGGLWCLHESTAPALSAPCAHCGTTLHVHQDALGAVKSGRAEVGYLVEKCPACHRPNAVHPAYGIGGVRTSQVVDGAPAMQMKLVR